MLTQSMTTVELHAATLAACPRPRAYAYGTVSAGSDSVQRINALITSVVVTRRPSGTVTALAPVASQWLGFAGDVRPFPIECPDGGMAPASAAAPVLLDRSGFGATRGFGGAVKTSVERGVDAEIRNESKNSTTGSKQYEQDQRQHLTARRVTRTWRPPH